jgi:predicted DNA binding CopG/RHH family protein
LANYKNHALYTKSLHEKKQTIIRFSVSDLAIIKSKSKELGIGYQNLIQALVHNYATGKIKLNV